MDYWFRMEVEGWEHIPEPPALLIGIHSGAPFVWDAWTVGHPLVAALRRGAPAARHRPRRADGRAAASASTSARWACCPRRRTASPRLWPRATTWPSGRAARWTRCARGSSATRPSSRDAPASSRPRSSRACRSSRSPPSAGADAMPVLFSGRRLAKALQLDRVARLKMFPVAVSAPWGINFALLPEIPLPDEDPRCLPGAGEGRPRPQEGRRRRLRRPQVRRGAQEHPVAAWTLWPADAACRFSVESAAFTNFGSGGTGAHQANAVVTGSGGRARRKRVRRRIQVEAGATARPRVDGHEGAGRSHRDHSEAERRAHDRGAAVRHGRARRRSPPRPRPGRTRWWCPRARSTRRSRSSRACRARRARRRPAPCCSAPAAPARRRRPARASRRTSCCSPRTARSPSSSSRPAW